MDKKQITGCWGPRADRATDWRGGRSQGSWKCSVVFSVKVVTSWIYTAVVIHWVVLLNGYSLRYINYLSINFMIKKQKGLVHYSSGLQSISHSALVLTQWFWVCFQKLCLWKHGQRMFMLLQEPLEHLKEVGYFLSPSFSVLYTAGFCPPSLGFRYSLSLGLPSFPIFPW